MTQAAIRKQLRQRRQALSEQQQRVAADNLAVQVCQLTSFKYSRRIAFYLANDSEIDPFICLAIAQASNKQCYLPILQPLNCKKLFFAKHQLSDKLVTNQYGIKEPRLKRKMLAPPWSLDIIFLPLVAFDGECNRLGMGGGYYDRTLAFKRQNCATKPLLIGLAHHCQHVENLTANPWDIPLDAVVTDQHIFLKPTKKELI